MPTLTIKTNVATSAEQHSAILKDCSQAFAKLIGKPEQWVMVILESSIPIIFNGSTDPTAYCQVDSIGNLGETQNKQITKGICTLMNTHFKIAPNRVYIGFNDKSASDWGWNNNTFA